MSKKDKDETVVNVNLLPVKFDDRCRIVWFIAAWSEMWHGYTRPCQGYASIQRTPGRGLFREDDRDWLRLAH